MRIRPFGMLGPVVSVGPVGMTVYGMSWVIAIGAFAAYKLLADGGPLKWEVVVGSIVVAGLLQATTLLIGKRARPAHDSTAATFD